MKNYDEDCENNVSGNVSSIDQDYSLSSDCNSYDSYETIGDEVNDLLVSPKTDMKWNEMKKFESIEPINEFTFDNNSDLIELDSKIKNPTNCIDIFNYMLPDGFFSDLVSKSNEYAQEEILKHSKIKPFSITNRFKSFTEEDIKKYLGLKLWMGMHSNSYYQGKDI